MKPITVEKAIELILNYTKEIKEIENVGLYQALGRILAQDMVAEFDNPPFDRSPIDGYACKSEDLEGASQDNPVKLKVTEEIDAGMYSEREVKNGDAVRIMTGAAIPPGCDCCIRQEDTDYGEENVAIYHSAKKWENYCFCGEDFKKGTTILKAGTRIKYVETGVLAGMGRTKIPVYRQPRVVLLTSGDEVVEPGNLLPKGKIYNINLTLLAARLMEFGITPMQMEAVKDDAEEMAAALKNAASKADVIITTGAVSVGKKDIMHEALQKIGAQRIFWKVKAKPGMPTLFSVYGEVPIVSLSGNPFGVAVMVELLIRPLLQKMKRDASFELIKVNGTMAAEFTKRGKGRRFIRAIYKEGLFYLPEGLHSNGVISSMAGCNCLIDIQGGGPLQIGDEVEAILL